ncbi:hypothetical protein [Paraburkholderia bannensis]|uniref:hypothetical protein n=1 Tax=Paraburkholderia bannensis TaxID=765414 RepID=UPI002AB5EDD4|nr:hypothetical protein [Paraburkholderia bannensis]
MEYHYGLWEGIRERVGRGGKSTSSLIIKQNKFRTSKAMAPIASLVGFFRTSPSISGID